MKYRNKRFKNIYSYFEHAPHVLPRGILDISDLYATIVRWVKLQSFFFAKLHSYKHIPRIVFDIPLNYVIRFFNIDIFNQKLVKQG